MLSKFTLPVLFLLFTDVLMFEKIGDPYFFKYKTIEDRYLFIQKPRCMTSNKGDWLRLTVIIKSRITSFQKRMVIRETWGNQDQNTTNAVIRTVFNIGVSNVFGIAQNLTLESRKFKDIIQSDFEDTYRNLTIKTFMGIKWAREMCVSSDFFLFADDDVIVLLKRLVKFLRQFSKKDIIYAGNVMYNMLARREKKYLTYVTYDEYLLEKYPPYVLGGCVIYSRRSLEAISVVIPLTPFIPVEDAFIGLAAKHIGIKPTNLKEVIIFFDCRKSPIVYNPEHFKLDMFKTVFAIHGFKSEDFIRLVWKNLQNSGFL